MCCNKKVAKVILFIFNTLFFILGAAILAAGIVILLDKNILNSVLSKIPSAGQSLDQAINNISYLQSAAYVFIGVGAVILIIGFCGCFGAIKEVKCLLFVYSIIVTLILAAQIAAAVIAFLFRQQVTTYLQTFLNNTIAEKYEGLSIVNGTLSESIEPYSAAWDVAMISLECCGNYNYSDFENYASRWNKTYSFSGYSLTAKVPISCCKTTDKTAMLADLANFQNYFTNYTLCMANADPTYTNTVNCYDQLVNYFNTYTIVAIAVGITILVVEFLAIIMACSMIRSIGKDDD